MLVDERARLRDGRGRSLGVLRHAVDRRRPFRVTLRLRAPTRRVLRIKATVRLADGSKRTLRRSLTPRRLRAG